MPDILVHRIKKFGEVIEPNPSKFIREGDHHYIIYEGDVEISKSDEAKLTEAIYKHVQKCIKNSEDHVNQQIGDLERIKSEYNECFEKLILNKKLKKVKSS